MLTASMAVHLFGALKRAGGRVLLWFFVTGAIAAVVVELVGIFASGGQLSGLTHLAALALGVAVGYAAGLTVLMGEIIHTLITTVRDAEHLVEHELSGGGKVVGAFAHELEKLEQRL